MESAERPGPDVRRGVAVAWAMAVVHVVVVAGLTLLARTDEAVDEAWIVGVWGSVLVVGVLGLCCAVRVPVRQVATMASAARPGPTWRAAVRHGWRPWAAWAVGVLLVLGVLRGTEGVGVGLLLVTVLGPMALAGAYVVFLLVVAPAVMLVASVPALARPGAARRPAVVRALGSLILLSVLPMAVSLTLAVDGVDRWDWIGPLVGVGTDPDRIESTTLLWVARACGLVAVTGVVGYLVLWHRGWGEPERPVSD